MTPHQFLDAVYQHFGVRSINTMYDKCMEVLDTIQMGFSVRGLNGSVIKDFASTDARVLRQSITKSAIQQYLQTKEVYQITRVPLGRKSFNWTVVENKCIKWQMDTVYLGSYLKTELGWTPKKAKQTNRNQNKKQKTVEQNEEHILQDIAPESHAIFKKGGLLYVVFVQPQNEWKSNKVKIHWMNTSHKDWETAVFKYTYEDVMDDDTHNNEVWKMDNKTYKRYRKITADVNKADIIMSGFSLTSTNKLRANTQKELKYRLTQTSTTTKHTQPKKAEPTEYSYLLTIIDVFSKYAWVFPITNTFRCGSRHYAPRTLYTST